MSILCLCCLVLFNNVHSARVACDENKCKDRNGYFCNNQGNCTCDKCACDFPFTGEFCEQNLYDMNLCPLVKDCVQCVVFQEGPLSTDQCDSCHDRATFHIDSSKQLSPDKGRPCIELDINTYCMQSFAVDITDNPEKWKVTVLKEQNCLSMSDNNDSYEDIGYSTDRYELRDIQRNRGDSDLDLQRYSSEIATTTTKTSSTSVKPTETKAASAVGENSSSNHKSVLSVLIIAAATAYSVIICRL